jgi:hypothetical protein
LNSPLNNPDQTIRESIRKSFFLKPEALIQDEWIRLYHEGTKAQNLNAFSQQIAPFHTDQFAIHITHDIDWINPRHPYSFANVLRSALGKHAWLTLKQTLAKNTFVKNIEQLIELEKQLDVQAIYCIGAMTGTQLGRYDIRYSINGRLTKKVIEMILSRQHTIGLQSSYHAFEKKSLVEESHQLNAATHETTVIHRCHYLNAPPSMLYPQLEEAGLKYELGFGSSRQIGLKNQFPGKFKPIDPVTGISYDVTVIPLVLMDNAFFYAPYHEVLKSFRNTLHQLKNYNGSACISFHPENMLLKPQLYNYFEEIIHICKEEGALINPPLT